MSPASRHLFSIPVLALLACALVPAPALAQKIVKWTDANGQVHYSDHAPADQGATAVSVQSAPRAAESDAAAKDEAYRARLQRNAEIDASLARERMEGSVRRAQQEAKNRAAVSHKDAEKQGVAECNARHETYCNNGLAGIQREALEKSKRAAERAEREREQLRHNPTLSKDYQSRHPYTP